MLCWERMGTSRLVHPGPRDKAFEEWDVANDTPGLISMKLRIWLSILLSFSLISLVGPLGSCSQMIVFVPTVIISMVFLTCSILLCQQLWRSHPRACSWGCDQASKAALPLGSCSTLVLHVASTSMDRCSCLAGQWSRALNSTNVMPTR